MHCQKKVRGGWGSDGISKLNTGPEQIDQKQNMNSMNIMQGQDNSKNKVDTIPRLNVLITLNYHKQEKWSVLL